MDEKSSLEKRIEKRLVDPEFKKEWVESEPIYNKEREEISLRLLEATKSLPITKLESKEEIENWLDEEEY